MGSAVFLNAIPNEVDKPLNSQYIDKTRDKQVGTVASRNLGQ